MLRSASSDSAMRAAFRWQVPDLYNIATSCCDQWAIKEPDRVALTHVREDGAIADWTYGALAEASNRLANGLSGLGIRVGDRIGLWLSQSPETLIAHLACYKLGAIAVPLALVFGQEALTYRLHHSGAKLLVAPFDRVDMVEDLQTALPDLRLALLTGIAETRHLPKQCLAFDQIMAKGAADIAPIQTRADDPALLIYTSGTTGQPKGALHGHRVVLGHLPGMQLSHNFLPAPGDRIWTPADWAWAGGLLNVLLPALHLGVPVVSEARRRFDPEAVPAFLTQHRMRNVFLPPTALKLLRSAELTPDPFQELRSIASAGEPLGSEMSDWAQGIFGQSVNDAYGQTECNLVIGGCNALGTAKPGLMGRAVPGHTVAIVNADGQKLSAGTPGQIAIEAPDPVLFLGYWQDEAATSAKYVGPDQNWFLTGDQAVRDEAGYIRFIGRSDDLITSAGYRIGPAEVEDCLLGHPAVALAGVVGEEDALRTEIVVAHLVLKDGFTPSGVLADDISLFVRKRLSAHAYPRKIIFQDALPMTASGKIIRRAL